MTRHIAEGSDSLPRRAAPLNVSVSAIHRVPGVCRRHGPLSPRCPKGGGLEVVIHHTRTGIL